MTSSTSRAAVALPPLSRRGFLGGVGAASLATFAAQGLAAPSAFATSEGTVLPLVAALPDGEPDRTLFAPNEQVFAAYLMILAPLANSVIDDDEELFGWMEDGWQRLPNEPFNARIMEHVATLSWFYAHQREWNPYYLDANLLGRLDAALTYYLKIQHDDGSWPEYRWDEHGLAPTGFGTVALSAALRDLLATNALPERRAEIEAAIRASSAWLVDTSRPHWTFPVQFVNQVVAGLAGVAQASAVLADPDIAASLADRCALLLEHGQAPAGFFNEPRSYDAGYNFTVMLPDLGHIYEQTQDPSVVELTRRWAEWFGYVVVLEPGETRGFYVGAFSARNASAAFETSPVDDLDRGALGRVFLPLVPALGSFYATAEEKVASRAAWTASPDPVEPREKQDSSARLYMHVPLAPDGVSAAERDAQVAQLPYLRAATFTQVREGTLDQHFVFARRPGYYLAAMYGVRPYARQRTGTAHLWHPAAGTVVAAGNNVADDAWTTITAAGVSSALSAVVATHHEGPDATGEPIARPDLHAHEGVFTTRYVTADGVITTDVAHWPGGIRRSVDAGGPATEQIPLVVRADDVLAFSDGTSVTPGTTASATASSLTLTRGGTRFVIGWGEELPVTLTATDRTFFADASRRHHVLTVAHAGSITTEVTAVDLAHADGRVSFGAAAQVTPGRGGRGQLATHVVNTDDVAVDVRLVSAAGAVTYRDVAPGSSVYDLREARVPVRSVVAVVTTRDGGLPRVAVRRLAV
ncbi:hypothetical protein Bcav_0189 [Beutenbergia cavernae DSM 12333]|uniref:Uncharacterized protein n=1 Tax=Beutenbergia cavernae (strain ATCC BAA-8 / DSM 12333 / CCUG 43141 / JCM 11478 / NBRC 16432 / NCIMB 13614 / HKI 0122) TaxID=471853 RepID=C5BVL4_BEUC1|nr:hypothetical protein [Beutenbergia cavernae]ACQ78454.1 hypothetical protein Bcav_0189 [Beutenbergia cavernae DSM 12333]